MQSLTDLFWRPIPDVRVQERPQFLFFASLATLISLAQTLGLASAEALFMAEFGAHYLPLALIGGSIATVLSFGVYAARVGEVRNDTLFIQLLVLAAMALVAGIAAIELEIPGVSAFLLCFFFVTQAIFINHLWTFTTDYFDTVTAKRLIPLFTIGGSVGGVVGGLLAASVTEVLGVLSPIAGWAFFLFVSAFLIRFGRRHLHGWGPLNLVEADETSVEGILGAVRFVRNTTLGRALLLSSVGMILAMVLARFMWMDTFARRFTDPAELATFIGLFLAATNVLEIAIEMTITPWLIRRTGVPSANLVHPCLTLLSFGGLAYQYNLFFGALARMNGEMLENALATPVRALLCNAIPMRFRGRVRAFLEGIVVYAGMSIGGVALWVLHDPDPFWFATAGAVASVIYLIANLLVRREYLQALVSEMQAGRLDLADLGDEIGNWEASYLASLWEQMIEKEGEQPTQSLLKMIPSLSTRGVVEPLKRAATHESVSVRISCITALASSHQRDVLPAIVSGLEDADAQVRLASLRGLIRRGNLVLSESLAARLIRDADSNVRAEAAVYAGRAGLKMLEQMIVSPVAEESIAALAAAPVSLLAFAQQRLQDPDSSVRAASLECLARIATDASISLTEAIELLSDKDPRIRRAAILLLANFEGREAVEAVATAISDSSREVQFAAETLLISLGELGADAVEGDLGSDVERTASAALRVTARSIPERASAILRRELWARVRALWQWSIASSHLPLEDNAPTRFLRAAYADGVKRNERLSFQILELLEGSRIVRNVEKALRFGPPGARGNALEVLSNLGDRGAAQLLVNHFESIPLQDQISIVRKLVSAPEEPQAHINTARESRARWIRLGADALVFQTDTAIPEEEVMDHLLALREISLFEHLSLDQLEAVLQITTEIEFLPGEVIMREGEHGEQLYLLLDGRVRIVKNYGAPNERQLNEQLALSYFGEMGILAQGVRSATVVAVDRSRVLSLDGSSLRDLLLQIPEISFGIFRVLVGRLRAAEELGDASLGKV
jgi:HEAT repeat protein